MKLSIKQTLALDILEDNVTNELLYGGAAGGGKTALGCYWQIKRRLKYPESRGLIGRAILKTLKETTLLSFFEIAKLQGLSVGTHFDYNDQSKQIKFYNGSIIFLKDLYAYPSDPEFDELGGLEITDVFIDEANQVSDKARNVIMSRTRYGLKKFDIIPKFLYTCNPAKNWVYSEFYKPTMDNTINETKKFIPAFVDDNSFNSEHYKKSLERMDTLSKERLLFGNWEYSLDPSQLIEYEKILDAFTNDFVPIGDSFITCDVARFGKDSTVIGVWSGLRVRFYQFNGKSVVEVADLVKRFQQENKVPTSHIVVDEDGVGGGVCDILRCKGFVNNSSPLENPITRKKENFDNLKSQCYYKLAELINKNEIHIIADGKQKQIIIEELEQVKQKSVDNDAKKGIIPKDKVKQLIGRSPDFSDTLAMRMYFEYTPKFVVSVF
jgi:hypothetical protein